MKITVIGAGNMGSAFVSQLVRAGHQVSVTARNSAKQTAAAIADSIGFAVVDAGGLKNARYLEPLAGLNIYLGYGVGLGTAIAPIWIRKA
jgi:predicted dinucleotide-binding enzyme